MVLEILSQPRSWQVLARLGRKEGKKAEEAASAPLVLALQIFNLHAIISIVILFLRPCSSFLRRL